jgi:hypothetical protein
VAHRLDLRVSYPPGMPDGDFPGVRLLLDGRDLLTLADREDRYIGMSPLGVFADDPGLLPADPPRRVMLYFTGTPDPAEPCLTAVIRVAGDQVIWSDLHDSRVNTGDFDDVDVDVDLVDSQPLGLPDIAFEREQYLAEVHRAMTDREWESEHWDTAELLCDRLRDSDLADRAGWYPDYAQPASPDGHEFQVSLSDEDDGKAIMVVLAAEPGSPAERAAAMAAWLLATPASDWPVATQSQR